MSVDVSPILKYGIRVSFDDMPQWYKDYVDNNGTARKDYCDYLETLVENDNLVVLSDWTSHSDVIIGCALPINTDLFNSVKFILDWDFKEIYGRVFFTEKPFDVHPQVILDVRYH